MAKAIYLQNGDSIEYAAAADIGYMDVVPLPSRIGVAVTPIKAGGSGTIAVVGVYELPAATATEIKLGDAVFWNATNGNIDKTVAGGVPAGWAVADKAASETSVLVKIG